MRVDTAVVVEQVRDRALGSLIGCLLGDAAGRPLEGVPRAEAGAAARAAMARMDAGRGLGHSDDGEMMLALGAAIVANGTIEPVHVLYTLAERYEPARGYGRGTARTLRAALRGTTWPRATRLAWPEGSKGNGAAVRVAPVAIALWDAPDDALEEAAAASARATHVHPDAIAATVAVARHIRAELRSDPPPTPLPPPRTHAPTVLATESVPHALHIAARARSFRDAIHDAIALGGDTDTVAAIVGAIVGARVGGDALPTTWVAGLEAPARSEASGLAASLTRR